MADQTFTSQIGCIDYYLNFSLIWHTNITKKRLITSAKRLNTTRMLSNYTKPAITKKKLTKLTWRMAITI